MLTKTFNAFFKSEQSGGLLLIACTAISLILSNTPAGTDYISFWNTSLGGHSLTHWINDGLMAVFFLLIGLELEREVYAGELSQFKNALFPFISALGGVLMPAFIYLIYNYGTATQPGAGIPMATDIAFAIGILSLLGKAVPPNLKVFLTALAVIDDLFAILIIAFFYSTGISTTYLLASLGIFLLLLVMNRLKINFLPVYITGGIAMWYCMLHSGVHATIAGVLLAFAIPFQKGEPSSISYKLEHALHKPVAYIILPLFALANTCIVIQHGWISGLTSPMSIGILSGLILGKPLGILAFSGMAAGLGICTLPFGLKWKHIAGAGMLAGIGFTMSIFITLLAFPESDHVNQGKIAIILASAISACAGLAILKLVLSGKK